jgi:hypothetical protein
VNYRHNSDAARKLVGVGESNVDPAIDTNELAAWTIVATTILNLDKTITSK